jgi:hypothetical protein
MVQYLALPGNAHFAMTPPRPRLSDSGNEDEMEQSFCKAG